MCKKNLASPLNKFLVGDCSPVKQINEIRKMPNTYFLWMGGSFGRLGEILSKVILNPGWSLKTHRGWIYNVLKCVYDLHYMLTQKLAMMQIHAFKSMSNVLDTPPNERIDILT